MEIDMDMTMDGIEADPTEPTRIVVTLWNKDQMPVLKRAFTGTWLFGDEQEGLRAEDPSRKWVEGAEWSVALTVRQQLFVYSFNCFGRSAPSITVYPKFEDMKSDDAVPRNVVEEVAVALGLDYEVDLDI